MRLMWLGILLLPLLLLQGWRVRRQMIRLPEAAGPRYVIQHTCPSQHNFPVWQADPTCDQPPSKPLRIMILGDSAAAGVGVAQQAEGLFGRLLEQLQADYAVELRLQAQSGFTTRDLMAQISQDAAEYCYDVVITSIGVNDVTRRLSPRAWINQQKQLYALIQSHYQPRLVLITAVPPMQDFSALPQPLRWYLGQYAMAYNQQLERFFASKQAYRIIAWRPAQLSRKMLAEDGFHPGAMAYAVWAQALALAIRQHV